MLCAPWYYLARKTAGYEPCLRLSKTEGSASPWEAWRLSCRLRLWKTQGFRFTVSKLPMALHQQVRLSIADAAWSSKATYSSGHDFTTLVTKAPLRHDADAQLLKSASLHRLFRMGATVYLPDIYCISALIFTYHTSHFVLLKMLLFIAYFAWGREII